MHPGQGDNPKYTSLTLTELPVLKRLHPQNFFHLEVWSFAQASPAATASWQLGTSQSPAGQLGTQSPAASWQLGDNSMSPRLGAQNSWFMTVWRSRGCYRLSDHLLTDLWLFDGKFRGNLYGFCSSLFQFMLKGIGKRSVFRPILFYDFFSVAVKGLIKCRIFLDLFKVNLDFVPLRKSPFLTTIYFSQPPPLLFFCHDSKKTVPPSRNMSNHFIFSFKQI